MRVTQRTERDQAFSSQTTTIYEHPFEEGAVMNTADINLRGRYPEAIQQWVRNTAVDAMVIVTKGRGQLLRPGQEATPISAEASVAIARGELYALEGENMQIAYVSTPPWTREQQESVEL